MTMEWISIGSGHRETPDGWWVMWDAPASMWEWGFRGMAMGFAEQRSDAQKACERAEVNSK